MKKNKAPKSWPEWGFDKVEGSKEASASRPKKKRTPKSPPESKLQQSIRALRFIAKQRPNDPEAQRRAQVATDLYFDSWSRHKFPTPLIAHDPAESRQQTNWVYNLPAEIYYEIFDHIVGDYPSCPQSKRLRAKTLLSLTCSCRLFQEILESRAYKNNKGFLKFWKQLTHVEGLSRSEPSDIILISKRCPSLQRLKIDSLGHLDLGSLLDASHVWGKTLRTLHLNWLTTTKAAAIPQLLEQLPVVEEVYLAHLYDVWPSIQALARLSPPRLKHYKGVSHRRWDPIHSLEVEIDICDMITSQADTLESISITGQYDLNIRVLEAIKKAKKLEFLNLEVDRLLTDGEREDLQAACPKLQICVNHYGREIDRHTDSDWSYPKCGSWGFILDDYD
ncbi:hypothetical protein FGLOB1_10833 [Fusarium globosum]|uniref:F-box domain-containing protein n=1 Tax=Fusarium globosum TaxID=78864 RepID=A0A8H5XV46_9HYPO|nr:hypothetical protein FGLOB1_10833 [Fusarium globosum]